MSAIGSSASQVSTLPPLSPVSAAGGAGDLKPSLAGSKRKRCHVAPSPSPEKEDLKPLAKRILLFKDRFLTGDKPHPLLSLPNDLTSSIFTFLKPSEAASFRITHPVIFDKETDRLLRQEPSICRAIWETNSKAKTYSYYILKNASLFKLEEQLAALHKIHALSNKGASSPKPIKVEGLNEADTKTLQDLHSKFLKLLDYPSWEIETLGITDDPILITQLAASHPQKLLAHNPGNLQVFKSLIKAHPNLFSSCIPMDLRSDKAFMAEMVSIDGHLIAFALGPLESDFDLIKLALDKTPEAIKSVSKDFVFPEGFFDLFLKKHPELFPFASRDYRAQKAIVSQAVQKNGRLIYKAHKSLQIDVDVARLAVYNDPTVLLDLEADIQSHPEVFLSAAEGGAGMLLEVLPAHLRTSKKLALCTIQNAGSRFPLEDPRTQRFETAALLKLFPSLSGDIDVVCAAIKRYYTNYFDVAEPLKKNLIIQIQTVGNFLEVEYQASKIPGFCPHKNLNLFHQMLPKLNLLTDKSLLELRNEINKLNYRFQENEAFFLRLLPRFPNFILYANELLFKSPSIILSTQHLPGAAALLAPRRPETLPSPD